VGLVIASAGGSERAPSSGRAVVDKLARGVSFDVADELEQLELPDALLVCLRPPLEQLGFGMAPAQIETSLLPRPLGYTLAKNGGTELALVNLPRVFYGATNVVVLAANGLGFLFGAGSRLHLWAEDRDGVPQYLQAAIDAWNGAGILARFHPWMRLAEIEAAADRAEFVSNMFELARRGGAPPGPPVVAELEREQFNELYDALHSAFDSGTLRTMLRQKLNRRLDDIAHSGPFPGMVMDVIESAEKDGWVRDLVAGALEAKPENPKVQAAAASLGVSAAHGGRTG
jgi:hypothetical protein